MGYVSGWFDHMSGSICLRKEQSNQLDSFNFPYYFFIDRSKSNLEVAYRECNDVEAEGNYLKCYCRKPDSESRKELAQSFEKQGIQTYELDLAPLNRYMTDFDLAYGEPRVLFFDLETDGRAGWSALDKHTILMISWHSKGTGKHGVVINRGGSSGEYDCIQEFFQIVGTHDLLVAWNGDAYDELVLKYRAATTGVARKWDERWRMVNFLDHMKLFQKYYQRDDSGDGGRVSFSLENISTTLLGKGKIKGFTIGSKNPALAIYNAWLNKPLELAEYAARDVELMVELEQKFDYISFHRTLSNLCGRFLNSFCLMSGYINDAYVLRYGRKKGVRFKTKFVFFHAHLETEKIEGAYVMEPIPGVYDNVCDLDFASLYPNVIRTFNISPEVKVVGGSGPFAFNGVRFSGTKRGIFSEIVESTLRLRKKYKDQVFELEKAGKEGSLDHTKAKQMSDAYKLLGNTMYGIIASPLLRYYDPECGEAVTVSARSIIQFVIAEARIRGLDVLYSDTDSCFINCKKSEALEFAEVMQTELDIFVQQRNATPGFIRLDLDAVYNRIFFIKKKRYAGIKDTGKVDVKGLEFIRTDGCKISRDMQKRIIDYILLSEKPHALQASQLISRYKVLVYERKVLLSDIVISQSLGRSLDSYKVSPPHVRIARKMLEQGREVYEGMKIPYYVIGKTGSQMIVKHADDYADDFDPQFYWDQKIYPPTQRVVEAVFGLKDSEVFKRFLPIKKTRGRK